ncbi:hypothetical protein LEP1GSC128_2722 [Leptospira borgpetersenii str. 200801926]|uniref:Uncharacterized protein n=1 Tax=Leptospira borgpetersenii str. 200801926 TaxID=1193009 RepID=A0ABP2S568_LEPBO|nr:hypothetical protein LEP1GSC128_2722 [Leptospira borgpetersenii str. 200801926]
MFSPIFPSKTKLQTDLTGSLADSNLVRSHECERKIKLGPANSRFFL